METIRKLMGAKKWLVTGGSWGASLAVLYAQSHPERVSALILRGFTDLYNHNEFDHCVAKYMNPQRMDELYSAVGLNYLKHNEQEMVRRYTQKLKKGNNKTRKKLYSYYCNTDDMHGTSDPKKHKDTHKENVQLTNIDFHYIRNRFFLRPKSQMILEKNVKKIKHIPITFIHGKFDTVCPLHMAYELHKRLKKSKLIVVNAGHTVYDKEIAEALVKASNDFKTK